MKTRRDILQTVAAVAAVSLVSKGASAAGMAENGKTWCISDHPHFDRVMAPWLVQRFVDKAPKFVFAKTIEEVPKGAYAVGFDKGDFSRHDENGTCFHKVAVRYKLLDDPAIVVLDRVNAQGIGWYLHNEPIDNNDRYARWAYGLLALSDATIARAHRDNLSNQQILDRGMPLYDVLYDQIVIEQKKAAEKKA